MHLIFNEIIHSSIRLITCSIIKQMIQMVLCYTHHAYIKLLRIVSKVLCFELSISDALHETCHQSLHGTKLACYTRAYVQARLSASFQSYTAVTPQDWQTYEEMRNLAMDKFGLTIDPIELPTQAQHQGKGMLLNYTILYSNSTALSI